MKAFPIVKGAGSAGWSWFSKLKYLFLGLIFGIMLVNAVIMSIEAKNIDEGVEYIGLKWTLVTETINEESLIIIEQEGIYDGSNGMLKGVWSMLKNSWSLIEQIFIMFIWLKVLTYISVKGILFDDSKTSVGAMIAVLLFFLVQVIVIQAFTDGDIADPFIAFANLAKAIPFLISPIGGLADKIAA